MKDPNAKPARSHHPHRSESNPFVSVLSRKPRMPAVFNIIRASVYSAVLFWTIICLAVAVHFHNVLLPSDLTRFVPFAIFVCTAGLLIILTLLAFGIRKKLNPISTRIELGCLGLAGTLWLALGSFLASSESQVADVECFASPTSTVPLDHPSFSSQTYQAQYRVLEAFSLFNVILVWGFLLLLLLLAIRQHYLGEAMVWYCPVTSYPWFNRYSKHSPKLPVPVTSRREQGLSRGRSYDEKEYGYSGGDRRPLRTSPRQTERGRTEWRTQRPPAKARVTDRGERRAYPTYVHDKFARGASPRR